jgi:7,8-dihydropterin-6-yl-methyl-4-(beta-D-ribofuranosyl)aminobenzene 5'-phosphate synthase
LVRTADGWAADPYQDDMALVIEVASGLLLLCGCCHAGLLNTLAHVQRVFERSVVAIVGGTHLIDADVDHLQQVCAVLLEMGTVRQIYLNHCSGEKALCVLQRALGADVVQPCLAGTIEEWV